MGGRSSSSSTTQNFTDASTVNANQAGSVAGVVGDGNRTEVNILDGGAIEKAFDFAGSVVDSGFEFGGDSLDFAEESLAQSYEFGAGSLDAAFDFSSEIAERSSLENRAILNSAINASNDAQSSVLKFARDVSAPQTQMIKAGMIGLAIFATMSVIMMVKK